MNSAVTTLDLEPNDLTAPVVNIATMCALNRGFHKRTKLPILALLPTMYPQIFAILCFICNI